MLFRLFFLCVGFLGLVPLLYMIKTGGTYDSSHYQYAAAGLCASILGFFFLLPGFILGGVLGLVAFKTKEKIVCDCIEFFVGKIKPFLLKNK